VRGASPVVLQGIALHAGVRTSVVLSRIDGPLTFAQGSIEAELGSLRLLRADRGVAVSDASGALQIDLIEHLMAAVGALGLHQGVRIEVRGVELPLLDGGALQYALALQSLGVPACPRRRRIRRAERVQLGDSTYEFAPSDGTHLRVDVEYDHPLISVKQAQWEGEAQDFVDRIARARTYGFLSEAEALRATARARGANTRDVIVLVEDGTTISEPPPAADECVLHKMLDLLGDLTIAGGIPVGCIRATRPGHRATHEALQRAMAAGVFDPEEGRA
jgi:UDP-3-O-[3-hydroxymyristoyl] N-acetylglucosamine deacetylase